MKRYTLKLLLLTSNKYNTVQFEKIILEASSMTCSSAKCYIFYDKDKEVMASYPINCTVIEKVEKI